MRGARGSIRWLVVAVVALIVTGYAAVGLSRLQLDSDLRSLLPAGDPSLAGLESMAESFGGDPIVVLIEAPDRTVGSSEGGLLSAERIESLLRLEGELSRLDGVVSTYGPATTLNQTVLQLKTFLADLSGQRDALEKAGLTQQLDIFDKRYGSLLVAALPSGLPTLRNPAWVDSVLLDRTTGAVRPQWRQYLPAPGAVAIYLRPRAGLSAAEIESLVTAVDDAVVGSDVVPSTGSVVISGAPVVTVGLSDQLRLEVPRLAILAFGTSALVLLLFAWTRPRQRLLPLVVMGVATAVALATFGWIDEPLSVGAATFLPIILGLGSYYPVYASQVVHRRSVVAVSASALAAFAALLASPLPFVRQLGLAIPVGIAAVVALSFLAMALPRLLRARGTGASPGELPRAPILRSVEQTHRTSVLPAARRPRSPWLLRIVAAVLVVAAGSGWASLATLDLKSDPQQLLDGLPTLRDAVHAESVIGYSGELDVRLRGTDVLTPEALAWTRGAEQQLVSQFGDRLTPVVTAGQLLQFLGATPTTAQIRAGLEVLPGYITSAVFSDDNAQSVSSFGIAWRDLARDRSLVSKISSALPTPPPGYEVEVSGLPVVAERGYEIVDGDRYLPSVSALAASGLMLLLLLPRRREAVIAVVAATVATGLTFGVLAVFVGAMNPLTMTLGVLTAAVASEFSIMMLAATRTQDVGLKRAVALAVTLSLAGYGVLLASALPLVRELGLALVVSVLMSAACSAIAVRLVSDGTLRRAREDVPNSQAARQTDEGVSHDDIELTCVGAPPPVRESSTSKFITVLKDLP